MEKNIHIKNILKKFERVSKLIKVITTYHLWLHFSTRSVILLVKRESLLVSKLVIQLTKYQNFFILWWTAFYPMHLKIFTNIEQSNTIKFIFCDMIKHVIWMLTMNLMKIHTAVSNFKKTFKIYWHKLLTIKFILLSSLNTIAVSHDIDFTLKYIAYCSITVISIIFGIVVNHFLYLFLLMALFVTYYRDKRFPATSIFCSRSLVGSLCSELH